MRKNRASRDAHRPAVNAAGRCASCDHHTYRHFELDRADTNYKPLHFHCREDRCKCVRIVEW